MVVLFSFLISVELTEQAGSMGGGVRQDGMEWVGLEVVKIPTF